MALELQNVSVVLQDVLDYEAEFDVGVCPVPPACFGLAWHMLRAPRRWGRTGA